MGSWACMGRLSVVGVMCAMGRGAGIEGRPTAAGGGGEC